MCKYILLFFCFSSLLANDRFLNCSNIKTHTDHYETMKFIKKANNQLTKNFNSSIVKKAFRKYFKIDVNEKRDSDFIHTVIKNINTISKNFHQNNYRCHEKDFGIWCKEDRLGIVPPPKNKIHLCPKYFTLSDLRRKSILIHEAFHLWGGFSINYFFEAYCTGNEKLKTAELIREADQYMFFIHYLAKDGLWKLECF